jgi:hypothetical protein
MARGRRRKCKCCRKLFRPDPRNLSHKLYCSEPSCRTAKKAASQARGRALGEEGLVFAILNDATPLADFAKKCFRLE